jgi:hypothetical protein
MVRRSSQLLQGAPSGGHAARHARAWLVEIRHRSLSKVDNEGCRKLIFGSAGLVSEENLREEHGR